MSPVQTGTQPSNRCRPLFPLASFRGWPEPWFRKVIALSQDTIRVNGSPLSLLTTLPARRSSKPSFKDSLSCLPGLNFAER